eukprot:Sdes_comp15551_c0_seq1m4512
MPSMTRKIKFKVVFCTGADEDSPAILLEEPSPLNNGWESQRFCTFPQVLIVKLEAALRIRKVQILSHQYKIATKLQLFIGNSPRLGSEDCADAQYEKLGYVSLSSNESAGFKARELFNQVGIVAINIIGGEYEPEYLSSNIKIAGAVPKFHAPEFLAAGEDLFTHNADPNVWGMINRKSNNTSKMDDITFDLCTDPEIANLIRVLSQKKEEYIAVENYDNAKHLKQVILILEKAGEELGKLEVRKHRSVELEDFDQAKS